MVKGIERFREYFRDFTDQYVLIGGAACDILKAIMPTSGRQEIWMLF